MLYYNDIIKITKFIPLKYRKGIPETSGKQNYMNKLFNKILQIMTALSIAAFLLPLFTDNSSVNASEDKKLIALTFDDGPNLKVTQEILDTFELYGAKGTFFLIGNNINDATAASVKRAHDMGCEIANHSKSHTYMSEMSESEMLEEINYVDDYVYKITGEHTKFFRAPFLNTNEKMYEVIDQTFICGFNCEDCSTEPQGRADAIISQAKDGLIVLMHDSEANSPTSEALKIAIPKLQKEGYEFVTLSELFERQGETPLGDRTYSEVTKYPCDSYGLYKNLFKGEASSAGDPSQWSQITAIDKNTLNELSGKYAIEVTYDSKSAPSLVLQKWGTNQIWKSFQPCYSNGKRACFLSTDIDAFMEEAGIKYSELDQLNIAPCGDSMTITKIDILEKDAKGTQPHKLMGDVNADGVISSADALMMKKWMLGNDKLTDEDAADFDGNEIINIYDMIMLKNLLIN